MKRVGWLRLVVGERKVKKGQEDGRRGFGEDTKQLSTDMRITG